MNSTDNDQQWVTSRALGFYAANDTATLGALIAELREQGDVQLLGFGVRVVALVTATLDGFSQTYATAQTELITATQQPAAAASGRVIRWPRRVPRRTGCHADVADRRWPAGRCPEPRSLVHGTGRLDRCRLLRGRLRLLHPRSGWLVPRR